MRIVLLTLSALLWVSSWCAPAAGQDAQATVVIDASDFLGEIQKDHTITTAAALEVPWIFNNTALVLGSRSNYVIEVPIPEPGTYYLYARSHGEPDSYFRVAVGDEVIGHDLGDAPLHFERAGAFELEEGPVDVRLMRIEGGPVMDVLVLTKDADFQEADLRPYELHPDVVLLKEYDIPRSSSVKFGDVNGDDKTDILVLTDEYAAYVFDNDGRQIWSYEPVEPTEKDEAPGLIWDLDQDGAAEVIHWRYIDGQEWLVAADGRTGAIKHQTAWPAGPLPHAFYNYRLAVGRLRPGYPSNILAFTDTGGTITIAAYDADLTPLWRRTEQKKKDHLGHYVYPVDLDADGIDEVVVSALVLDAQGEEVWNRFDLMYDHHDHVDSYRFADITGDGQVEMVTSHSEVGALVYDARDGDIVWQSTAEHAQQVEVGDFLEGVPGPQIAIGARTYGNRRAGEPYLWSQVWWFDPEGNLLSKWPGKPLNGNPELVKGDWAGDGKEELFWYKFRMTDDGTGELYFGEPVYHMFDFMGDRAEEVITLQGGMLKVYGSRRADAQGERVKRTPEYLQREVANHTHY